MKKRFIGLILMFILVAQVIPFTVAGVDVELQEAIEFLISLNIITAADTGEEDVTRKDFALFLAKIHKGKPEFFMVEPANRTPFDDVNDDKYSGYYRAINYCMGNGFMYGTPESEFLPEGPISFLSAVIVFLRTFDYGEGLTSSDGFLEKGKEIGLMNGFGLSTIADNTPTAPITKNTMIAFLYNYYIISKVRCIMDIDGDDEITAADATYILRYIVGLEDSLCECHP